MTIRTALVLLLAAVLAACRPARPASPPNVVLIVVDTLRADRLGAYGNPRGLTPFLDQLAARGTRFANTYAASSWTCPSIASLFTSRYPSQHGVVTFEAALNQTEVTLAQRLSEHGYQSAGFSANFRIAQSLGYAKGFGEWKIYFGAEHGPPKERGATLRADTVAWLAARPDPAQPVLLYLQYMEPHLPYNPPEPFRSQFAAFASGPAAAAANAKAEELDASKLSDQEVVLLESLYDAETAAVDDELRLLFDELERFGILRNAIVVVTADHGEEFKEHGYVSHGLTLFEPAIRVPLILQAPGFQGGTVVEQGVSLVDVAPTILDLAGVPAEPRFVGRSLVPLLTPSSAWERWTARLTARTAAPADLFAELLPTGGLDLRIHREAYLRLSRKLIVASVGAPELYDLASDPGERRPKTVFEGEPNADLYTALQRAHAALADSPPLGPTGAPVPLDDATREKLRALGYRP
jgi:arylsulfatase A-like enzyme